MVMYDNEFETKIRKLNQTKDKIEPQHMIMYQWKAKAKHFIKTEMKV